MEFLSVEQFMAFLADSGAFTREAHLEQIKGTVSEMVGLLRRGLKADGANPITPDDGRANGFPMFGLQVIVVTLPPSIILPGTVH
jgi:hypothetical protein